VPFVTIAITPLGVVGHGQPGHDNGARPE